MPQALVGQSLEAGVLLARRFGNLTALPEHPLFPAIHGRLIAGGFLFLGERLEPSQWAGAAIVLGAMAVILGRTIAQPAGPAPAIRPASTSPPS